MSAKDESTLSEKIAELEKLVAWFEGEDFVIEEAMERFEVAKKLAENIEVSLQGLKNDIQVIKKDFDEK